MAKFSQKVKKVIKDTGWNDNFFPYLQDYRTTNGVLDWVGEVNGTFYAVDSKDKGDRLRDSQIRFMLLRSNDAFSLVVHNDWSKKVISNQMSKINAMKEELGIKKSPNIHFVDLKTFEKHLRFRKECQKKTLN